MSAASGSIAPSFSQVRRLLPAVRAQRRIVEMQTEAGEQSVLPVFQVKQLIELATALCHTCDIQQERNSPNGIWWSATAVTAQAARDRLARACDNIISRPLSERAMTATPELEPITAVLRTGEPEVGKRGVKVEHEQVPRTPAQKAGPPSLAQPLSVPARPVKRARSQPKGPSPPPHAELGVKPETGQISPSSVSRYATAAPPSTKQIKLASGVAAPAPVLQPLIEMQSVPPAVATTSLGTVPKSPAMFSQFPTVVPRYGVQLSSPSIAATQAASSTAAPRRFSSGLDFHRDYRVSGDVLASGAVAKTATPDGASPLLSTAAPREALRVSAPSPRFLSHPVSLPPTHPSSTLLGPTGGMSAGAPVPDLYQAQVHGRGGPVASSMGAAAAVAAAQQQYYIPLSAAGYYQGAPAGYGYMYGHALSGYPMMAAPVQYAPQIYYSAANPYASMLQGVPPRGMTGYPPQ